jgi:hypothetical protein
MSDEQPPPTHQPWGAQPDPGSSQPPPPPPPPQTPPQPPPGAPYQPPPNPYPQPGGFDQYAAANPYGSQPYGGSPTGYPALAPEHPSATTGLVLGIVGLVGVATCGGITLVLSPFAWSVGGRALREIDASAGRYSGREKANAARIMGMIGTALLALGVLAIALIIVLAVAITPTTTHIGPGSPTTHHHIANS